MARGTQLSQLIVKLKAETGISSAISLTVDQESNYKTLLQRHQEVLYDEYDWPHLRVVLSKAIVAGSRFYDFPADATLGTINLERVEEVRVTFSSSPQPVERGIGFEEYDQLEPEDNERSDPIRRWDMRWTGAKTQIEVWPLPASAQTLRIRGLRELRPLISDNDVADLDDQLIVLFAAAEILEAKEAKNWQSKLGAANGRLRRLKGRSKGGSSMTTYGGGDDFSRARQGTIIRVA